MACDLGLYSPTICKNTVYLFLQDFVNLKVTQYLIGLANQKLYYFQILLSIGKSGEQY